MKAGSESKVPAKDLIGKVGEDCSRSPTPLASQKGRDLPAQAVVYSARALGHLEGSGTRDFVRQEWLRSYTRSRDGLAG